MTGVVPASLHLYELYRSQTGLSVPSSSGLTVFCDFDGPIIDVSERYYSTYQLGLADTQATYQAQGTTLPIQLLSKEQFWQMKQDRVPDVEIAMRSGLVQQSQIDVFLQRVGQIVNQPTLLQKDRLQPGVRWALKLLHTKGIRLVLVTLRCQQQATQILQEYGLADLFSGIYGADNDQAAYQNYADYKTQLLVKAALEQGLRGDLGQSSWMIGDTEADILAGQALEIPTIALTCGIRSRRYLERLQPTCILSDLVSAVQHVVTCYHLVQA
ncbi:HAD family hydrolase [Trichocoleus sp. FACHB-591]|uniref:HAD family hydrolase n=1 Tax=Trichocoleus sp. FACHB-591 TaxID=2692872 RepID=UPI00168455CB|nr:HAD family hydrolase [Trichocoleus sp. FACHB-591]MBD2093681.1 HAD family hydrolase [Trichocoleus sp. FACHB-591]